MDSKKSTAPALETQERQGDTVLTEKDLYCIARVLQGCIYKDRLFACCEKYCQYVNDCVNAVQQGRNLYFNTEARKHLEEVSGVYLGPLDDERLISGELQLGKPLDGISQANPMPDSDRSGT